MAGRAASPGVGNQRRDAGSRAPSLSSSQLDGLDLTLAESYMLVNDSACSPMSARTTPSVGVGVSANTAVHTSLSGKRGPRSETDAHIEVDSAASAEDHMGPHIHSNIQRYERVLWLLSREVDLDIQLDTGTKTVVGTHDAETWNELVHEARAQREAIEEETVGYESVLQQLRREAEMLARGSCNAPATDGGEKAMDAQGRVDEQLTDAKREEDELTRDLKAISKERESVQESLLVLAQEEHHLQDAEAHYWQTLNGLQNDVMCHTEQRDSLQQQIGALRSQLSRLQRTNVINDAFYIWVDGPFGTINSFRMGRLPNIFVDWTEINAAWGQATLLLQCLSEKHRFIFPCGHVLRPCGSFSKIEDRRRNPYELYGGTSGLFASRRFGTAMSMYLQCVADFADAANIAAANSAAEGSQNGSNAVCEPLKLPFAIDAKNGTLGDPYKEMLSIRQSGSMDAKWTKALKFLLANLKSVLKWSAKQGPNPVDL